MYWVIPANGKKYNHKQSFDRNGFIDWKQTGNFKVNDIVYIYCTIPLKRIMFKTVVTKTNLSFIESIDDSNFWLNKEDYFKGENNLFSRLKLLEYIDNEKLTLENLVNHGLKAAPQRAVKLKDEFINYVEDCFSKK